MATKFFLPNFIFFVLRDMIVRRQKFSYEPNFQFSFVLLTRPQSPSWRTLCWLCACLHCNICVKVVGLVTAVVYYIYCPEAMAACFQWNYCCVSTGPAALRRTFSSLVSQSNGVGGKIVNADRPKCRTSGSAAMPSDRNATEQMHVLTSLIATAI